jgi:hypothetical protein
MSKTIKIEDEIKVLKDLLISDILPKVTEISKRKHVLIYSLHNPLLTLKEPLIAHLEYDTEDVIAFCYDLDVLGHGDTESEALEDLRRTISDLYFELESNKDKLGPFPDKIWCYLSNIVGKK